jgi:cell shape-determining protein MreC
MSQAIMEPPMFNHEEFRNAVWNTYYDSYFQELMCGELGKRYAKFDLAVSLLVASTASGSTIAGLSLWSTPQGKPVWLVIAVTSSIAAFLHSFLHASNKVKTLADLRREFLTLRVKLETLRQNLRIQSSLDEQRTQFDKLRDRYTTLVSGAPSDLIATNSIRARVQRSLNAELHDREILQ